MDIDAPGCLLSGRSILMQSTRTLTQRPSETSAESRRRQSRNKRKIAMALRVGLAVQALITLLLFAGALWVPALTGLRGPSLMPLAMSVFLLPCWFGNALAGYLAPKYSAWQWAAYGIPAAFVYLLAARVSPFSEGSSVLHCWLTFNLVLCPALAGMLGHARRVLDLREEALRPRPWRG